MSDEEISVILFGFWNLEIYSDWLEFTLSDSVFRLSAYVKYNNQDDSISGNIFYMPTLRLLGS